MSDNELDSLLALMGEHEVPEHLRLGLAYYLLDGVSTGSFLEAVLSNDLKGAFGAADSNSEAGLGKLVRFLYNEVPGSSWGSPERYAKWKGGRGKGIAWGRC